MTSNQEAAPYRPDVSSAFRRDTTTEPGSKITYTDNLGEQTREFFIHERELWEQLDTNDDPLVAEAAARRLAAGYLIATAARLNLNNPPLTQSETCFANQRFAEASIELYGGVNKEDTESILAERLAHYQAIKNQIHLYPSLDESRLDHIINTYSSAVSKDPEERTSLTDINETAKHVAAELKPTFDLLLAPIFEELDRQPRQDLYSPTDIIRLLNNAKPRLVKLYPELADWQFIVETASGKRTQAFESDGKTKTIRVGADNRSRPYDKAKGKIAHELTHTLRSIFGAVLNDDLSYDGYPGFLQAEEGLACLAQLAYDGEIPAIRTERYLDYALALQVVGDHALSRAEITELFKNRKYIEGVISGKPFKDSDLDRQATKYAHRMFKGTRGESYADGQHPAVNTQDLAYSLGFVRATQEINKRLQNGKKPPREIILSLLYGGKYDFSNEEHTKWFHGVIKNAFGLDKEED